MNCSMPWATDASTSVVKLQAAGGHIPAHHRFEARFVDRHAAAVEDRDLARIDIEAQHVVADLRETGAGDEADVTGPDHRDLHAAETPGLASDALIARKRRDRIGRLRNRPPDHQIIGAVARSAASGATTRA